MSAFPGIEQWCQGKPIGLRIVAKLVATGSDDMVWGFDRLYRRAMPKAFPQPPDPQIWHQCYYRGQATLDCFLRMLFGDNPRIIDRLTQFFAAIRDCASLPRSELQAMITETLSQMTLAEWSFEVHRAYYFWRTVEREIDRLFIEMVANTKPRQPLLDALASPELQFFVRVTAPCTAQYKTTPRQLLDTAKGPDLKTAIPALIKLLKLDPALASVAPFNVMIHSFRHDPAHTHDYQRITAALNSPPFRRVDLQSANAHAAAIISLVAKMLRFPLTKSELRKLFDAVARDEGRGLRDADASTYDVYRKRVQRVEAEFIAANRGATFPSAKVSQ